MTLEPESQLWNALFESGESGAAPETVAWLMSGPDSHFIQLLASCCERDQLVQLMGVSRHTLRQVLYARFAPLREGMADGLWRRGVQRAMDELVELRPDLLHELPAYGAEDDGHHLGGVVETELAKTMNRLPKELAACV